MTDTILAFKVMGKIISGMLLTPESLVVLVLFGAFAGVMAIKIKLEP